MERPPSRLDRHSVSKASYRSPPPQRQPLGDGTLRANASGPVGPVKKHASTQRGREETAKQTRLPHNESLQAQVKVSVRKAASSPGPRRISEIVSEAAGTPAAIVAAGPNGNRSLSPDRSNKRDSVTSNASTNASSASPSRRKTHIGPWQLGRTIGRGGCSRVRIVRHSGTGQQGAAKIISKSIAENMRAQSLANLTVNTSKETGSIAGEKVMPYGLEREIVIMKLLKHPNVVQLFDVWENRNELYLIMEYVEGAELFSFIEQRGGLEEVDVVYLFRQIIGALIYCHRLHIHHRDLKPENILLDMKTNEIKLVDFGMAALQPEGRYLSTPCGSPHYAAPEVIFYKAYDGGKADVWSCGVILFVLLTGDTPFHYDGGENLSQLFGSIAKADYIMPPQLSPEAQDLIARILVPDPQRRISIEAIWNHPFLHKYDYCYHTTERYDLDYWSGLKPKIENWNVETVDDIDREILRNMRTLWHSERESTLIEQLLSDKPNQEKFFYSALLKHRDEQLENYHGHASLGYSASDRHHLTAPKETGPGGPKFNAQTRAQRTKSQFSILNDEHLYSTPSLTGNQPSVSSYDPFRASRTPVTQDTHLAPMNITLHDRLSSDSNRHQNSLNRHQRHPSALRIGAIKRSSLRGTASIAGSSKTSFSTRGTPSGQAHRPYSRCSSRASMTPSLSTLGTPSAAPRATYGYKRGVSFNHLRSRSHAESKSLPQAQTSRARERGGNYRRKPVPVPQPGPTANLVVRNPDPRPTSLPAGVVLSSKEKRTSSHEARNTESVETGTGGPKVRRTMKQGSFIDKEARKVSTELGKVCEQAFFLGSTGSSDGTAESITGTTATSGRYLHTPQSRASHKNPISERYRPGASTQSPRAISDETPKTFLARELAGTRQKLAAMYAAGNGHQNDNVSELLSRLDMLIAPSPGNDSSKRAVSAPEHQNSPEPPQLPRITEEVQYGDSDESFNGTVRRNRGQPGAHHRNMRAGNQTIRVVDPSSPTPVAPLNIRKRSQTPAIESHHINTQGRRVTEPQYLSGFNPAARESWRKGRDGKFKMSPPARTGDQPPVPPEKHVVVTKKRGWFKRKTSEKEGDAIRREDENMMPGHPPSPPSKERLGNNHEFSFQPQIESRPTRTLRKVPSRLSNTPSQISASSSDVVTRELGDAPFAAKRRLREFFKWRKGKKETSKNHMQLGDPADFSDESLITSYELPESHATDSRRPMPIADSHTNWIARFLHIKPASHILCFHIGRGGARAQMVRLLRDWRRFGIRDIVFDRVTNVISARVDRMNYLRIKPVSFNIELFTVLEAGRRAQLSVARFSQTRGAASSFKRVAQIIEEVLGEKGLLVEDAKKKKDMCEIL